MPLPARILDRINKNGPVPSFAPQLGPCWIWTGACVKGYGKVSFEGQMRNVHQVVYRTLVCELSPGQHIDHLCRNKPCCNPAHLEHVSAKENNRRRALLITHCPRGHEYTPANTRLVRGHRACRTCVNQKQNHKYANNPEWRAYRLRAEHERHQAKKHRTT